MYLNIGLNFLRECPLLSSKENLHTELIQVLLDCLNFFITISNDIKIKSQKYLLLIGSSSSSSLKGKINDKIDKSAKDKNYQNNNNNNNNINNDNDDDNDMDISHFSMDKQYAYILAQELIPHIFICFESIFADISVSNSKDKNSTNDSSSNKNKIIKINNLINAKGKFNTISYNALVTFWGILRNGELLPKEKIIEKKIEKKIAKISSKISKENSEKIDINNDNNNAINNDIDDSNNVDNYSNNNTSNDSKNDVKYEHIYPDANENIEENNPI